jgi:hypothetical protein
MPPHLHRRALHDWLLALALVAAGLLLVGADSNWDLRNYHLYNVRALLGWRPLDIAAAQLQGWHNPALDVPMYLLQLSGLPAVLVSAWLALPTVVSIAALLRLLEACAPTPPGWTARVVLGLLAITGAATGSTFALSMNDAFVGAGMLAALALVVPTRRGDGYADGHRDGDGHGDARRWLLGGLLAGAVIGLKLSGGFYALALAPTALVGGSAAARARRIAALGLGGLLGAGITYGPWAWHLWQATGNPFFPYFNQVFKAAGALPLDYVDARFLPATTTDRLLAPLRLLQDSRRFSELSLRDPRVLLGLLAFAWAGWRPARAPAPAASAPTENDDDADLKRRACRRLAVFMLVGTAAWLLQSGIYRYAIALEQLGALAIVVAVLGGTRRRQAAWLLALLVLVSVDTRRPHWGREASGTMAGVQAPALGAQALVVTATDDPLAYLALGLPSDTPLVALANNFVQPGACTALERAGRHRVAAQTGPLWWLFDPTRPTAGAITVLQSAHGLRVTDACVDYPNPLGPARLCRLQRVATVAPACPG